MYVSEERAPLGAWAAKAAKHWPDIPSSWWARPPSPEEVVGGKFTASLLWGWRTNLEAAVDADDSAAIRRLARKWPQHEVAAHVEMRLLLARAAEHGRLDACEALVALCGASVDGVNAQTANAASSSSSAPSAAAAAAAAVAAAAAAIAASGFSLKAWKAMQRASGGSEGQAPLHRAAANGHTGVVRFLLGQGCAVNGADGANGASPLHYAVARAHTLVVELLLATGRCNVHALDAAGQSPLALGTMLAEAEGGGGLDLPAAPAAAKAEEGTRLEPHPSTVAASTVAASTDLLRLLDNASLGQFLFQRTDGMRGGEACGVPGAPCGHCGKSGSGGERSSSGGGRCGGKHASDGRGGGGGCGRGGGARTSACECGGAVYCSKACRAAHWTAHGPNHRLFTAAHGPLVREEAGGRAGEGGDSRGARRAVPPSPNAAPRRPTAASCPSFHADALR
jgi:hypothetical protein